MNKIKKGDQVIVVTGRDKGKTGEVLQILEDGRALVNDIQLVKKHTRPNPGAGVTGGILTKEAILRTPLKKNKSEKSSGTRILIFAAVMLFLCYGSLKLSIAFIYQAIKYT